MTKKTPPKAVKKKTTPKSRSATTATTSKSTQKQGAKLKEPKLPPAWVKRAKEIQASIDSEAAHTRETRKPRIVKPKPAAVKTTELPTAVVEQPKVVTLPLITDTRDITGIPFKIENLHPWDSTTEHQWNAAIQDTLAAAPYEVSYENPSNPVSTWVKVAGGLLLAAAAGVVWYVVQV